MSVSPRRCAIFKKITFFRPDTLLNCFLMNFEALGPSLGTILGSTSHIKIDQKFNQILDRFFTGFELQFKGFWTTK